MTKVDFSDISDEELLTSTQFIEQFNDVDDDFLLSSAQAVGRGDCYDRD